MWLNPKQFKGFLALLALLLLPLGIFVLSDAAGGFNATAKRPLKLPDGTRLSVGLLPGQSQTGVVLVPALSHNQTRLKSLKRELHFAGYTVITFDFPGQGRSWGALPMQPEARSRLLTAALVQVETALLQSGLFASGAHFHWVVFDSPLAPATRQAFQRAVDGGNLSPQSTLFLDSRRHPPSSAQTAQWVLSHLEADTGLSAPGFRMPYPPARTAATLLAMLALAAAAVFLFIVPKKSPALPETPAPLPRRPFSLPAFSLVSVVSAIVALALAAAVVAAVGVSRLPLPHAPLFFACVLAFGGSVKILAALLLPKQWGLNDLFRRQADFAPHPLQRAPQIEAFRTGLLIAFLWLLVLILTYRLSIAWVFPLSPKQPWLFILWILSVPAFYCFALEWNFFKTAAQKSLLLFLAVWPLLLAPLLHWLLFRHSLQANAVLLTDALHHLLLMGLSGLSAMLMSRAGVNPIQTALSAALTEPLFLLSVTTLIQNTG